MKALNLFKKNNAKSVKATIQSLDKTQLAKVIGGTDTDSSTTERVVSPMAGGGRQTQNSSFGE